MGQIISAFLAIFIGEQPKEDVKALVEEDRQEEIQVENDETTPVGEGCDIGDKDPDVKDEDLSFNFEVKESKEEETGESVQKENFDNTLDLIKGVDTITSSTSLE